MHWSLWVHVVWKAQDSRIGLTFIIVNSPINLTQNEALRLLFVKPRQPAGLAHLLLSTRIECSSSSSNDYDNNKMQQVQAGKKVFGKCQPVVAAGSVAQRPVGQATYLLLPGIARSLPCKASWWCCCNRKCYCSQWAADQSPTRYRHQLLAAALESPKRAETGAGARAGTGTGTVATRIGSDRIGCHMCSTGYKTVFGSIDFVFVQFCNISLCCNFFIYANACAIF